MSVDINIKSGTVWKSYPKRGKNGTFVTYTLGVSRKNQDGSYTNGYQKVLFPKGTPELEKKTVINGTAFPTVNVWRDREGIEHKDIVWFITDFNILDDGREHHKIYDSYDEDDVGFEDVDEEIPF